LGVPVATTIRSLCRFIKHSPLAQRPNPLSFFASSEGESNERENSHQTGGAPATIWGPHLETPSRLGEQ